MPSERIQRQVDVLLDEAQEAYSQRDWHLADERVKMALGLDPESEDAQAILDAILRVTEEHVTTTSSGSSSGVSVG